MNRRMDPRLEAIAARLKMLEMLKADPEYFQLLDEKKLRQLSYVTSEQAAGYDTFFVENIRSASIRRLKELKEWRDVQNLDIEMKRLSTGAGIFD